MVLERSQKATLTQQEEAIATVYCIHTSSSGNTLSAAVKTKINLAQMRFFLVASPGGPQQKPQ